MVEFDNLDAFGEGKLTGPVVAGADLILGQADCGVFETVDEDRVGVVLLGAFSWNRAGAALLQIAMGLSLLSALIILFGLRKPTAASAAKDAMSTAPSH